MNHNNMRSDNEQTSNAATDGGPVQYLSPNFLTHFPLAMSSAETFEGLSWNDVSGLFRRRDAVPVTFIDEDRLMEEIRLNVFDKKTLLRYESI